MEQIHAENPYMQLAIEEAIEGITNQHGGPFGCVIVKDGMVIGKGHNRVLSEHDPTCHGEIAAIREAGKHLQTHDLTGCTVYTTGEPCPMCLFACMWANVEKIYYGCTLEDNSRIGFRDQKFEELLADRDTMGDFLVCVDREACQKLFDLYEQMDAALY